MIDFPSREGARLALSSALTAATLTVLAVGLAAPVAGSIDPLILALTFFVLVIGVIREYQARKESR